MYLKLDTLIQSVIFLEQASLLHSAIGQQITVIRQLDKTHFA